MPVMTDELDDLVLAVVRAEEALASAIGRATSAKHVAELTRMYQAAVDELPAPA